MAVWSKQHLLLQYFCSTYTVLLLNTVYGNTVFAPFHFLQIFYSNTHMLDDETHLQQPIRPWSFNLSIKPFTLILWIVYLFEFCKQEFIMRIIWRRSLQPLRRNFLYVWNDGLIFGYARRLDVHGQLYVIQFFLEIYIFIFSVEILQPIY